MKQRRRIYYTESQKAIMWDRWQKGDSLQQIARLFDRNDLRVIKFVAEKRSVKFHFPEAVIQLRVMTTQCRR